MVVKIENRFAIEHLMRQVQEVEEYRNAKIDMTLNGRYIGAYLPKLEMGTLELVRESYYRRKMTKIYDELKAIGIDLELDFDPSDYRPTDPALETSDDL